MTTETFSVPLPPAGAGSPFPRGTQLLQVPIAPLPGLPRENLHENHDQLGREVHGASVCIVKDKHGGGEGSKEHKNLRWLPHAPATKFGCPQTSRRRGRPRPAGFPPRVLSPLRPPRLFSVAAAGGRARRRCDSAAFLKNNKKGAFPNCLARQTALGSAAFRR